MGALSPRQISLHDPASGPDDEGTLLAADSWLVDDGRVRAPHLHQQRFAAAVAAARDETSGNATSSDSAALDEFWAIVPGQIPAVGRYFPRVELRKSRGRISLSLRVRPAPPVSEAVRLWTLETPDPRRHPTVKGPDITALAAGREQARAHGASEAVITTGFQRCWVVEGTTTSLVWWRGHTLHTVHDAFPRIAGVTERLLTAEAALVGIEVVPERVTPHDFEGVQLWALNALHGIRPVAEWVTGGAEPTSAPHLVVDPRMVARWQSRIDRHIVNFR